MSKSKARKVFIPAILKDAVLCRLDDEASLEKVPTLLECLLPAFDGTTLIRQPGKLSITAEGGHWRVTLDCPTEILSLRFATPSLVGIIEAVEEHLLSGAAVFVPGWTRNKKRLPTVDDPVQ